MRLQKQLVATLRSQIAGGTERPPEAGALLWNAFNQLSRQRGWHQHGPNPIPVSEIEAYCRLMRLPLEPRHVAVILAMDRTWMDHIHSTMKPNSDKSVMRDLSRHPLTPALMDAMFK